MFNPQTETRGVDVRLHVRPASLHQQLFESLRADFLSKWWRKGLLGMNLAAG